MTPVRGAWVFEQGWTLRLLGLLMMGLAIAAVIAPPFSGLDTRGQNHAA
jgi:hypothetical protein